MSSCGRCAFCGEHLSSSSKPIPVVFGAPSDEGRGTFTKLKPLRWRFLTNKAPRPKFMCKTCAEKRQVPQRIDQQPVSLDSSWTHGIQKSDGVQKPHQREVRKSKQQKDQVKLEHLDHHDKVRQQRKSQRMQQTVEKREKLQERRDDQINTHDQPKIDGRRRRSSQESDEAARRSSVLQPFANHRVSREPVTRSRPASTVEMRTRTSSMRQRASVETPTRSRKPSTSQSEPRGSEKKGSRLSSTADILGMSRSLELPPNYFDMSSSSPTFTAPEHDPLGWKQIEMQMGPQVELRKKDETEEERQRRRSASYAHMLLRMRRHYGEVQVNGTNGHPATAPPRRIRAERRAKSVASHIVKEDEPIKMDDLTKAGIDLDYLRAYKDAR